MGYLLTPDTSIEVLLAMIGAKRGGKGSITRIMQALVGTGSHASMMLNDLAGDFGLSGVTDKRVIIIPDAHDADLSRRSAAIERIKSITGNDEVSVKPEEPIDFVCQNSGEDHHGSEQAPEIFGRVRCAGGSRDHADVRSNLREGEGHGVGEQAEGGTERYCQLVNRGLSAARPTLIALQSESAGARRSRSWESQNPALGSPTNV